jgi:TRAP transporter TAXI family solute receptor
MAANPLSTIETLGRMVLDANGIKPKYKWGGTASNLEAMKAGTVQAWQRGTWRDGGMTELSITRPITFLSVTDEHIKKFNEKYPVKAKGLWNPAGHYKGQDKPYHTLAFVEAGIADKKVAADVIYKILKALYDKRMNFVKVNAALKMGGFEDFPKLIMEYAESPLHPGAVKFLRERGHEVPDELLPPEMK